MTSPVRRRSKGLHAAAGSREAFASAPSRTKKTCPIGFMSPSVPPETHQSVSPRRMLRNASPMAWFAAAHAVTVAPTGPRRPCSRASSADGSSAP
jgi:hypothetical protein